MSLTNPNKVVTEERLSEFYQGIFPYLGGMPDVLANKFSKGDLYSTDEKMIGCWVDSKPLYQKTVPTGGNVPSGATLIQRTTQTGYDTILYTKTTDSPIAIGSDTDYSTDEKIVGTWIDGRPIWQKNVSFSGQINTRNSITLTVPNIEKMIYSYGIVVDNGIEFVMPEGGLRIKHPLNESNVYIDALDNHNYVATSGSFITLGYTKTS